MKTFLILIAECVLLAGAALGAVLILIILVLLIIGAIQARRK